MAETTPSCPGSGKSPRAVGPACPGAGLPDSHSSPEAWEQGCVQHSVLWATQDTVHEPQQGTRHSAAYSQRAPTPRSVAK